jgi:hypothetical protein
MHGITLRTPVELWLDAVVVILVDTPVENLEKLESLLSVRDAQIDPDAVRENWGSTPEHQAMMGGLTRGAE